MRRNYNPVSGGKSMNREEAEQYLFCAMSIGEQLLICGAEVGRVEDTIRRICLAYGAERADVFSITSSIVTTIYGNFGACTQTRRVQGMKNDLNKLDELNQLSRKICMDKPAPQQIKKELNRINNGPGYSFGELVLIYAVVSGSFAVFFGGDWKDMAASAAIGIILKFLEAFVKKGIVNSLVTALICSAAGGFLANLAVYLHLGTHVDLISIGNIMLLIPGIPFTNSVRDMFSGDMITGLIRFVESIILALVIALGFTCTNFLFR